MSNTAKPKPGTWEALSPETLSEDLNSWPSMVLSSYGPVREQPCIITDADTSPEELHIFALQEYFSTGRVHNFFNGLQGESEKASQKVGEMQRRGPQEVIKLMYNQRIDHSRTLPDISPCPLLKTNSLLNASNVGFMRPDYKPSMVNPFEILNRPEHQLGANASKFGTPSQHQSFGTGTPPAATLRPNAFSQFSTQAASNSFAKPAQQTEQPIVSVPAPAKPFSFAQTLNSLKQQAPAENPQSAKESSNQSIFDQEQPKPAATMSSKIFSGVGKTISGNSTAKPASVPPQEKPSGSFSSFASKPTQSQTQEVNSSKPAQTPTPAFASFAPKPGQESSPVSTGFAPKPSEKKSSEPDSKPKFSFLDKLASLSPNTASEVSESSTTPATTKCHEKLSPVDEPKSQEPPVKETPITEEAKPKPASFVPPSSASFFKSPIETSHAKISQAGKPAVESSSPYSKPLDKAPVTQAQDMPPVKQPQAVPKEAELPKKTLKPEETQLVDELDALHEYKDEFSALDDASLVAELDKLLSSISIQPSFKPMPEGTLPAPIPFVPTPSKLPAFKSLPPLPPPLDPLRAHAKLGDPSSYSSHDSLAPWEIEAFTCSDFAPGAIPSKPPSINLLIRKKA